MQLLQELAAATDADWVAPLAAQELARIHRETGKHRRGREGPGGGLERFPADPRLYDRSSPRCSTARGQAAGEAQDLMEKVMVACSGEPRATAARFLYNTVRPETFQAARRFLDENAQSRLSVLAQALDTPDKASGAGGWRDEAAAIAADRSPSCSGSSRRARPSPRCSVRSRAPRRTSRSSARPRSRSRSRPASRSPGSRSSSTASSWARATQAPWTVSFEAGDQNIKREIRAVVHGASGATATHTMATQPVQIDDQLDLRLQQLFVTVTRGRRRPSTSTRRTSRSTTTASRRRSSPSARGELPLTAVLLLDTSESMQGERIKAARRGAATFLSGMRAVDEAIGGPVLRPPAARHAVRLGQEGALPGPGRDRGRPGAPRSTTSSTCR